MVLFTKGTSRQASMYGRALLPASLRFEPGSTYLLSSQASVVERIPLPTRGGEFQSGRRGDFRSGANCRCWGEFTAHVHRRRKREARDQCDTRLVDHVFHDERRVIDVSRREGRGTICKDDDIEDALRATLGQAAAAARSA